MTLLLNALAALTISLTPQQSQGVIRQVTLADPSGSPRLMIQSRENRLSVPKLSPKRFGEEQVPWEFEWLTAAFGKLSRDRTEFNLRFRVYSQERKANGDLAIPVARMLLRMWEFNYDRLRIDHSEEYNGKIVDVFLCYGGEAGGEQLFDLDDQINPPRKVNTVYFYQINSFTDPLEMAREIAHEYGHATLPAVGGFETPEDWANGYLGEKLYLRRIRDEMQAKAFDPQDAMGVGLPALDGWVKQNVDPLVMKAALNPPNMTLLRQKGPAAMDAYLGLALYTETLYGPEVFARSMKLTGSTVAKDYPEAIALAAEEPELVSLRIPATLAGKPIWIPLGKGKLSGATVTRRQGAWALIKPTGPVKVRSVRSL